MLHALRQGCCQPSVLATARLVPLLSTHALMWDAIHGEKLLQLVERAGMALHIELARHCTLRNEPGTSLDRQYLFFLQKNF